MANVIEILLKARDEASAKLKAARGEISKTGDILRTVAPQLGAATSGLEGLAEAGMALGPVGLAAAGAAASIAAIAVAARAAFEETKKLAGEAEQLGNLEQKTGIAARTLQGLQFSFENAGVPAESLNTSLRFLAKNVAEGSPLLKELGITTKDTGEAFFQLTDIFARHRDGANKSAYATGLLGRAGSDLIPVMNQGAAQLEQATKRAEDLGRVLSTSALDSLSKADEQFDTLEQSVKGLRAELVLLVSPGVTAVVTEMNRLLGALREIPKKFDEAKTAVRDFISGLPGGEGLNKLIAIVNAIERINRARQKGETPPPPPPGPTEDLAPPGGGGTGGPKNLAGAIVGGLAQYSDGTGGRLREVSGAVLKIGEAVAVVNTRLTEFGQVASVLADFREAVAQVLDVSNALSETLSSVWGTLESSLASVFQGMLQKGQTFKAAMSKIFRDLVSTILAELARLAAAYVFRLLLKIVGTALFGPAGGAAGEKVGSIVGKNTAMPAGQFAAAGSGGSVTNVYLSAIDAQSLDDAYRSYNGSIRRYNTRAGARRGF